MRPLIDLAAPALEETAKYGLALLARASVAASGGDKHAAFFSLFHHLLGMVDESSALLRQCAGSGIALTLRSGFEALVSLEYMNESFERRAYAWLIADVHRKWQFYKTLDPRLPEGKELEQRRLADRYGKDVTIRPPAAALDRQYARFERLLARPGWKDAEAEWQRVRGQGKDRRRPEWYWLYDGPRCMQVVAERVRRGYQYHMLYREWSVTMHASGLLNHFRMGRDREIRIVPMRNGSELAGQAHLALGFGLDGIRLVMERYLREETQQFATWYVSVIKGASDFLGRGGPPRREANLGDSGKSR